MCKRFLLVLVFCCPVFLVQAADPAPPPAAHAGPTPTEASIKEMLELAQAHKLVEATMNQMTTFMKQTMAQASSGHKVTPDIQKDIDRRQAEMEGMFKEMLDWNKLEPMYVRVYQKSFTQGELDGMVAFYKTPAGKAMVVKLPVVMQNTMSEMQQMVRPMMEKMQKHRQEVAAELAKAKQS